MTLNQEHIKQINKTFNKENKEKNYTSPAKLALRNDADVIDSY